MSIYEQAFGNAYAGDPEFDNLSGYCTAEYSYTWYDAVRNAYIRTTRTHINLGRADPGTPADPDANMQREYFDYDNPNRGNAVRAVRRDAADRFLALRAQIQASLTEDGPASAARLADRLGGGIQIRVLDCLRRCPEFFVYRGGQFKIWSLVGQEYTKPKVKKTTSCMIGIRDTLAEHGPQTVYELMAYVNVHRSTIHNTLLNNPQWFCVVGKRAAQGGMTRVWDLAESMKK